NVLSIKTRFASMDRLFDRVVVCPPAKTYVNCVSTNPEHDTIDVNLALKQHQEYVNILRENDIHVIELKPQEKYPDSCFVQDTAVIGTKIAVICRFGEKSRRGEEEIIRKILEKEMPVRDIKAPGTLEGGDVLVTDQGIIFVGETKRTNRNGINQLARCFPHINVEVVPVSGILHLMSACSYLGSKTIVVCPKYVDPSIFHGFKLIKVPEEEVYATNLLYIGDKKVLMPDGYPKTRDKLRKTGFKPIEVNLSEFWKGDGGVTCLSLPFYKCL
nr:arginine deiminase family protein [Candidatus Baldrarchaeota archaeon]